MSKNTKNEKSDFFKQLINQLAGDPSEDSPLIPEYSISGTGVIWCYDPVERSFKKIYRGARVFVIKENYDYKGRTLVYTYDNLTVCIDPEELDYVGFD
tara:strand:+ start:428 stop:721 length:294 start_codon:yes stop_codon:yes gene_type:complete